MVVYLDHAATTPLRPEALTAMLPYLTEHFGNPSGSHAVARRAKEAIEDARDVLAAALGCEPREIVFTGSGTEGDNLAITGTVALRRGVPICSAVEHHAVLHTVEALGGEVVPVDRSGIVDVDALEEALRARPDISVVSVMLANNETGVIQPIDDIAEAIRRAGSTAVLHTDAVQAFPWVDVGEAARRCDLVAVSGHKFGGPKGVGALVVREGLKLAPLVHGGGQERERRSGTHNVAGIVGLAAAAAATVASRAENAARVAALRDRLLAAITAGAPDVDITVRGAPTLPNICHVLVAGVESEALVFLLDDAGVCASAGSACASGAVEPSHVLLAMGIGRRDAAGALRLSLGPTTTADDVDFAAKAVVESILRLRGT